MSSKRNTRQVNNNDKEPNDTKECQEPQLLNNLIPTKCFDHQETITSNSELNNLCSPVPSDAFEFKNSTSPLFFILQAPSSKI